MLARSTLVRMSSGRYVTRSRNCALGMNCWEVVEPGSRPRGCLWAPLLRERGVRVRPSARAVACRQRRRCLAATCEQASATCPPGGEVASGWRTKCRDSIDGRRGKPGQQAREPLSPAFRNSAHGSPDRLCPEVAIVPGEQLVAAVARERDRHVAARHLRDEERRQLRRVGERLVVPVRDLRDQVERVRPARRRARCGRCRGVRRRLWRAPPRRSAVSRKPIVKVRTGRADSACISATTVEESMPPERNAPSGTSDSRRSLTASRRSASSAPSASASGTLPADRRARASRSRAPTSRSRARARRSLRRSSGAESRPEGA